MHGPELARRMGYLYPRLKVLYMSGYNENPIFQREISDPSIPIIQKPFSIERLLKKVREALDQGWNRVLPIPPPSEAGKCENFGIPPLTPPSSREGEGKPVEMKI